jgi:hypothetical protein
LKIDVGRYVLAAQADEHLRDEAWIIMAFHLGGLTSQAKARNGTTRGSDAGKCSEELRCILFQEPMLPDDPRSLTYRMGAGAVFGLYLCSLFSVAYEAQHPEHKVVIEAAGDYLGVPFHADAAVYAGENCIYSFDVKTGYFPGKPKAPVQDLAKDDHTEYVLQAGHQAGGLGNEDFGVFVVAMADGNYKGEAPIYGQIFHYEFSAWKGQIHAEYTRLRQAERATGPLACDFPPGQTWRIRFCKNPKCPSRKL